MQGLRKSPWVRAGGDVISMSDDEEGMFVRRFMGVSVGGADCAAVGAEFGSSNVLDSDNEKDIEVDTEYDKEYDTEYDVSVHILTD